MKHQIMDKIVKEIENVGKLSKNIIKYGSIVSALLFIGSGTVLTINNFYLYDFNLMYNAISMMKASTTIFAEVVIGGLVIDHLIKNF